MQLKSQRMSVADYLAMEEHSQIQSRREYVDGETYAMSGATRRHSLLVSNLCGHAWKARRMCQVFAGAMKVRIEARNSFYYPDVMACCDPDDREDQYVTTPCFIIEVLSPSTASIDKREKRLAYLTLKSLDEYVIVDQDRMRVDVYRGERGPWASQVLEYPEDILELTCIGLRVSLSDIYDGVKLPPLEVRSPGVEEVPDYAAG